MVIKYLLQSIRNLGDRKVKRGRERKDPYESIPWFIALLSQPLEGFLLPLLTSAPIWSIDCSTLQYSIVRFGPSNLQLALVSRDSKAKPTSICLSSQRAPCTMEWILRGLPDWTVRITWGDCHDNINESNLRSPIWPSGTEFACTFFAHLFRSVLAGDPRDFLMRFRVTLTDSSPR